MPVIVYIKTYCIRTVPVFAWPSFSGLTLSRESVGLPVCTHVHASCVSMILVYGKENKYYFKKTIVQGDCMTE